MFELTVRQRLAALVLLFFLAVGGILLYFSGSQGYTEEYRVNAEDELLFVHVCGAVVKPGVISLKPGARKSEALQKAGGALPEGDLDRVNLAEFVLDGEQIYLPRKGEIIANTSRKKIKSSSALTVSPGRKVDQGTKKANWPRDLNTATAEELIAVPGIGPSLAARIIEYRSKHGRFSVYEDLLKVSGIGTAKLEQFRAYLCVK